MPLKPDLPWQPTALRGNYLFWKNPQTGETRKTYISQGELTGIKADLAKYNKLRLGLGYPWEPVRYDGEYIYYKSSVSGLETKSFVPPDMRDIATQFLKASGEPGKARVLDMSPIGGGKYQYIDRGNFTTLRDISTAEDIAKSPWMSHPYTIRQGTVQRVLAGNQIVVDGVVISIRNTDTPIYVKDKAGWQAAKDYTTSLLLNKQVTLKILTDMPRDNAGNTVADVTVANEDIAGKIMMAGNAPLKSAEPQQINGLEWFSTPQYAFWGNLENFANWLDTSGKTPEDNSFMLWLGKQSAYYDPNRPQYKMFGGTWGNKTVGDRRTPGKMQREGDLRDDARLGRIPGTEELARRDRLYFALDIIGDPLMYGMVVKAITSPITWALKPAYLKSVEFLNSFDRPFTDTGSYSRFERLWRQTMTLPRPLYHITNAIGDAFNAMLGGLRDPRLLKEADKIIKLPSGTQMMVDATGKPLFISAIEGGEKVVFTSAKGKAYTVAELKYYEEYYHFERIGQSGGTAGKGLDIIDRAFRPLQKASEWENARLRFTSFLDRLKKGDEVEQAFAHSTHYLIDYSPRSLTAFEQAYLYPNIPFYMFLRQNTILQVTEFVSQPQTYVMTAKFLTPFQPTADEYSRLRDYQRGMILIRNPANPESFIRFRLPFENVNALASSLSTPEKAVLLTYPWLSMFPELMQDKNYFDNTKPSKDYVRYFTKKFTGGYYFQVRDYETMPLPQFLLKQLGIDAVTPGKAESDVSQLLQDAGNAKTQEILQFEATQRAIEYENKRSSFVQNLMKVQASLPPALRDRPAVEFGGFDYINIIGYSEGALVRNLVIARKKNDLVGLLSHYLSIKGTPEYYRVWDKISVSDTNTLMRQVRDNLGLPTATRNPNIFEYKNSQYYWQDSKGDNIPKDWEGGFWDRFSTDVLTDFTNFLSWGKDPLAKTLQYGKKELQLSSDGEKLYNTLRVTRGEFEAKHLIIDAAKKNPSLLTIGRGLRIVGTDLEVPYSAQFGEAVWKYAVTPVIIKPVKYIGGGILDKISGLSDVIQYSIWAKPTPTDLSAFNSMLRDLKNNMRLNLQLAKADVWILQEEAHKIFGTGYQNVVRQIIEDESLRVQYPSLKPIVERIIARNYAMASIEIAWKLLDNTRANYILHEMMPQALEMMEKGKLKMPPMKESLSSSDRNMFVAMGKVLNPYNFERAYGMTIDAINTWSMKEQGFAIFFEDAFGLMRTREEMHVTSVSIKQFIDKIGKEYGVPIGTKVNGYGISKIHQLKNVQLPFEVIRWLESVDLIKANVAELNKPGLFRKALKLYDFSQRAWKIGVTFLSPSWLQGNVQSGLFVDAKFARTLSINPYKSAWTELARGNSWLRWLFKMSDEGVVFKDVYGNEHTANELLKEAEKAGVLGSQGMTDIGQYAFGIGSSPFDKVMKTMSWALTNSENIVRLPLYFKARLEMGRSVEEATAIVTHYHGDYSGAALSQFEKNVARRLLNFYVWDKFAPTLLIKEAFVNPSSLTIPYHVMTAWNGQQGLTEREYMTDRELVRYLLKIPGTDAYTTPAIFSLANSALKYSYIFKTTEQGFYWEELHKDPNLLKRFIKDELPVDWLKHGAGVVKIDGNKAIITYAETGDHISATLNQSSNKLVFIDDQTGQVLREFPINIIDGKVGVYKDLSLTDRIERVMGEIGSTTLNIPLELALNRDFKFGSPLPENRAKWFMDQFVGAGSASGRSLKEFWDTTIPVWEKFADLVIGWYISHLSHNQTIPWQDVSDPVKKMIEVEVMKVERGDYLGCGI